MRLPSTMSSKESRSSTSLSKTSRRGLTSPLPRPRGGGPPRLWPAAPLHLEGLRQIIVGATLLQALHLVVRLALGFGMMTVWLSCRWVRSVPPSQTITGAAIMSAAPHPLYLAECGHACRRSAAITSGASRRRSGASGINSRSYMLITFSRQFALNAALLPVCMLFTGVSFRFLMLRYLKTTKKRRSAPIQAVRLAGRGDSTGELRRTDFRLSLFSDVPRHRSAMRTASVLVRRIQPRALGRRSTPISSPRST